MTETVLVVAKAPASGRSKTRLVPPLSADQAAELHEALLLDTLDACRAEGVTPRILHASPADAAELARLAPGTPLVLQEGRGLADALRLGIAGNVEAGPVAIVSSDVPGLPTGSLRTAFAALAQGADVVLGPAVDGGYWLIAMRQAHEEPFRDIPWSTPAALAVTRSRCGEAGLRVELLHPWRDLDTLVDLSFSIRDAEDLPAPRTVALLHRLAPLVPPPPQLELADSELLIGSPWRAMIHDRLRQDGRETAYAYLAVPRAVFVAAVTREAELVLVRQYRHPVRDWTLEVPAGEFLSVMGPSGSGKSTILNLVAGLDTPSSGRVIVAGEDLARLSDDARSDLRLQQIGFVFQTFNLFPSFTVEENVAWPLEFLGTRWREARHRAAAVLEQIGVDTPARKRRPAELSGGEQQRVAIARALVTGPQLLLADEPTGNLDSRTGEMILDILRKLNVERHLTVVLVTHSAFAATYGHRTVELRDGSIVLDVRVPRETNGALVLPLRN